MTTGVVDIKIFGPPVASADLPTAGLQVGASNHPIGVNPIVGKPWPMTLLDGVYRPAGPNGLPLLVPPGCEADGYRELLVHERDHNWISQYTQFLMFMGMVDTSLQFYDGTNYYASYSYIETIITSGFYVSPETVTIPSDEVSAITFPNGSTAFTGTDSADIIPSPSEFTVSTYSVTYGQTSLSLTTSLTSKGNSFNVAQVGFMPAGNYNNGGGGNGLYLLGNGNSPNAYTNLFLAGGVAGSSWAVYTSYQLSQVYTVPADGAITIEYGISATL